MALCNKVSQVIAAEAIMKEAWDMLNQGLANQMPAEATARFVRQAVFQDHPFHGQQAKGVA